MYRVWDNDNNQYGDLKILSNDNWCEFKTRFKIEKYFCNLDGVYYYEGDIVIVRNYLDNSIKPYKASIVWDNHRFAFRLMDDTVDCSSGLYPLMDASTFGINLRLVGNVNASEEKDED